MLASFRLFPPLGPPAPRYTDERLGLSFSYPDDWAIDGSDPTFVQLTPGFGGLAHVHGIMVGPATLETFADQLLEAFADNPDFREISRQPVEGEHPGYLITFELGLARFDVFVTLVGARAFFVIGGAQKGLFDQHRADFNQVLDSFEVTLDPATEPIDADAEVAEILDAIGERVVRIRGLPAPSTLERGFRTREEFEPGRELLGEEARRKIERMAGLCVVLDLCSPSDDLLQATLDLIGRGVRGYYKPGEKSLTVVPDQKGLDPRGWLTYAHEYAHALQDRIFDLSSLEPEDASFDASEALGALVEGDAKLVEYLFYESLPPERQADLRETVGREVQEFSESPELEEAPRILAKTFGWQHSAGTVFAFRLYLEGGFEAIDRAYRDPPRSTEQVLHPEKYLAGDAPLPVVLPDLSLALGDEWQERDSGVLGELLTGIYLGTFLSEERAQAAAEGWGGDAYSLFQDGRGRTLMAMRFRWDTGEDAEEFFQSYLELVDEKSGGRWPLVESKDGARLWIGEGICVYLGLVRDRTVVVIGPDRAAVEAIVTPISGPAAGG